MNFTNLRYFLTVAEEKSISAAAQKLFLSQQALSGHIRRLEAECGTPLFERNPQFKLTHAGTCVVEYAKQILSEERDMLKSLSDIINISNAQLAIGTSPRRSSILLPEVIPQFLNLHPSTKLVLRSEVAAECEKMLSSGELDIIAGYPPFLDNRIRSVPLFNDEIFMLIPQKIMKQKFTDPYKAINEFKKTGVDISLFLDCPFMLINPGRIRDIITRYLNSQKISLNIVLEHSDVETLLKLCKEGVGITFAFEVFFKNKSEYLDFANEKYFCPLRIQGLNMNLVYSLAYNRDIGLSPLAKDFISISKEKFSQFTHTAFYE